MTGISHSIAIVGSGPAGCYLAQSLRREIPDAELVVIEKLPVPYGLVRYGVAADHQGTKAVSRQFDRLFDREEVHFIGNVEIGNVGGSISLDELRQMFDVVVLATGLSDDVPLGIPGSDLPGVVGAGRVTRALNVHPLTPTDGMYAGESTLIVGAGNVAIDIARLLAKTTAAFSGSDVDDELRHAITKDLRRIEVVGRSSAGQARFDLAMLRELGQLDGVAFEFHEASSPPTGDEMAFVEIDADEAIAKRKLLTEIATREVTNPRVTIAFRFGLIAEQILGEGHVERVRFRASDGLGEAVEIAANSVFSAVGFRQAADDRLRRDTLVSSIALPEEGRLDAGLYCAGWLRTGPRGSIPTHRSEAKRIAGMIASDLTELASRGTSGLEALRRATRSSSIGWSSWLSIDEYERSHAGNERVRAKIRSVDTMLKLARNPRMADAHP
ncbi:MAG TPA: FAD-dependent oxidoreductase [Pseudolysinimonas sp.]|nr:FAD-dependent oxidoreductase [Pseudolysinimonas sp.]